MKLKKLSVFLVLLGTMLSSNSFASSDQHCETTPGQNAIKNISTIDR